MRDGKNLVFWSGDQDKKAVWKAVSSLQVYFNAEYFTLPPALSNLESLYIHRVQEIAISLALSHPMRTLENQIYHILFHERESTLNRVD